MCTSLPVCLHTMPLFIKGVWLPLLHHAPWQVVHSWGDNKHIPKILLLYALLLSLLWPSSPHIPQIPDGPIPWSFPCPCHLIPLPSLESLSSASHTFTSLHNHNHCKTEMIYIHHQDTGWRVARRMEVIKEVENKQGATMSAAWVLAESVHLPGQGFSPTRPSHGRRFGGCLREGSCGCVAYLVHITALIYSLSNARGWLLNSEGT